MWKHLLPPETHFHLKSDTNKLEAAGPFISLSNTNTLDK